MKNTRKPPTPRGENFTFKILIVIFILGSTNAKTNFNSTNSEPFCKNVEAITRKLDTDSNHEDTTIEPSTMIVDTYNKFKRIDPDSLIYLKSSYELNKFKFTLEDSFLIEKAILTYDRLNDFFNENKIKLERLLHNKPSSNTTLHKEFNLILKESIPLKIDELHSIAIDFNFSIQIDDMLFAFPISRKTQLKHTHIDTSSIKFEEAIFSYSHPDTDSYALLSDEDFIQTFAVYNADHESIFEAHIIIRSENLTENKNAKHMNTKSLLTTRFLKLPGSSQFVDAYWVYEKDKGELLATKLYHYKHAKNSLVGKSIFHINNTLEGVFYGGKADKKIIDNYLSLFVFDSALPIIKKACAKSFCYDNKAHCSTLVNNRTKRESLSNYWATNCIKARPGDIVTLYKYSIFRSKPTTSYLIFNRDNKLNNFIKANITTANSVELK